MYPLDDDNLDRLSREAAEHFEVEAGASGWDHLEQRLNKEMPQEKKRRRFLFWLFLITATTGGALVGILKYQPVTPLEKNVTSAVTPVDKTTPLPDNQTGNTRTPNSNQPETVSGNKETPATTAAPTTADKQPVGRDQQNIAATTTKPGISAGKPDANQAASTTTVTVPTKSLTQPATNKQLVVKNQPVEKTPRLNTPKQGRVRNPKAPAAVNYAAVVPATAANRTSKPAKQQAGKRAGSTPNQTNQQAPTGSENNTTAVEPENRPAVDEASSGKPVETTTATATVPSTAAAPGDSVKKQPAAIPAVDSTQTMARQQPRKKGEKIQQPWEFGVMAGPDMSAVSFGPLYKPGFNFGLQVGYRFSERWSVNAGVIYTKKFYKTDSSHFEYKTSWPSNKTLSRVEGNCSMWEVPVNVRYDLSFNNKRRWFVSTGLSSYLMDKEDYDVYYRWNGSSTYEQPLVNDTTNSKYWFSILNLSVGMERSLGKRFSLQAEPYLKVPLKDLGMGNMRMNSYGILFTLKYKPFLNSKRSDNNK